MSLCMLLNILIFKSGLYWIILIRKNNKELNFVNVFMCYEGCTSFIIRQCVCIVYCLGTR